MKTIYKYKLNTCPELVGGKVLVEAILPVGAEPLTVQIQNKHDICLWAKVDPKVQEIETRRFIMFGTGMPIHDDFEMNYISTILIEEGTFVYHVFELLNKIDD